MLQGIMGQKCPDIKGYGHYGGLLGVLDKKYPHMKRHGHKGIHNSAGHKNYIYKASIFGVLLGVFWVLLCTFGYRLLHVTKYY